jgi:hypothetical protein
MCRANVTSFAFDVCVLLCGGGLNKKGLGFNVENVLNSSSKKENKLRNKSLESTSLK